MYGDPEQLQIIMRSLGHEADFWMVDQVSLKEEGI